MNIGSLFSGIGGLELGLEWSGVGEVIWQVESDDYCRKVLQKHWPKATRYEDVRSVGAATLAPVDLICGGFPCQDVSGAGKGAGLTGSRSGLWSEFARILSEMRPRWAVVENVLSGASRWLDTVVCHLEELSYECLPVPLSAEDVGAPHLRKRIFIVARITNAERERRETLPASLANTESLLVQEKQASGNISSRYSSQGPLSGRSETHKILAGGHSANVGNISGAHGPNWWATEPDVGRVAHGVPARAHRLRALGNAVVPQCAEVIGWMIRELEGGA